MILMKIVVVILFKTNIINNMNIKLESILNNIQCNMIEEYYFNSIIDKYSAKYNIVFNRGDEEDFLFVDKDYYYYYIYLCVFRI